MRKIMLSRLLPKKSYCSRNEAKILIKNGRVKVNNKLIKDPFKFVDINSIIKVNDMKIKKIEKVYFMLNKPEGYIVSRKDDLGRKTVFDLINYKGHLSAVGRLDFDCSGLLILTNDSDFGEHILNPETHIPKVYHVRIDRILSKEKIKKLKEGVLIGDYSTKPAKVKVINSNPKNYWIELTIFEGKFHQIKKMINKLGAKVLDLNRVAIGNLYLGNLKKGEYRKLSIDEVNRLFNSSNN